VEVERERPDLVIAFEDDGAHSLVRHFGGVDMYTDGRMQG